MCGRCGLSYWLLMANFAPSLHDGCIEMVTCLMLLTFGYTKLIHIVQKA